MDTQQIIRELTNVENKYKNRYVTYTGKISIGDMARDCRIEIQSLLEELEAANSKIVELNKIISIVTNGNCCEMTIDWGNCNE